MRNIQNSLFDRMSRIKELKEEKVKMQAIIERSKEKNFKMKEKVI